MHLMPHWAEHILRYGALQKYSTERHEQTQKTNLTEGRNASNHMLNYLPKVITFQRRILWLEMIELNRQALS